jgi:hypothetical protein
MNWASFFWGVGAGFILTTVGFFILMGMGGQDDDSAS